jgi:hypothetical protein
MIEMQDSQPDVESRREIHQDVQERNGIGPAGDSDTYVLAGLKHTVPGDGGEHAVGHILIRTYRSTRVINGSVDEREMMRRWVGSGERYATLNARAKAARSRCIGRIRNLLATYRLEFLTPRPTAPAIAVSLSRI